MIERSHMIIHEVNASRGKSVELAELREIMLILNSAFAQGARTLARMIYIHSN